MNTVLQIDYDHPFLLAKAMTIPGLGRRRKIWAFLPDGYANNPEKRYPVVYFQDAQNVFENWKSPFGHSWETHQTMRRLHNLGHPQAIVIGIEHANRNRVEEFTPLTRNGEFAKQGNAYADFLANKLKNFVDKKLRTLPEREHNSLIGSSMGGLITLYAGMKHQDVFSKLGVFSPALWVTPTLFPLILKVGMHYPMTIYLTVGEQEGGYTVKQTKEMHQTLIDAGFPREQLYLGVRAEGKHEEAFWEKEFETCYLWFLGK